MLAEFAICYFVSSMYSTVWGTAGGGWPSVFELCLKVKTFLKSFFLFFSLLVMNS
jgi:hypothetical protein